MSDEEKKVTIETGDAGKGNTVLSETANTEELEERALSVFSSDRNEDIVALVFCLITTFLVLVFTKWMV